METAILCAVFIAVGAMVLAVYFAVEAFLAHRRTRRLDALIRSVDGGKDHGRAAATNAGRPEGLVLFGRRYPVPKLTALLRAADAPITEIHFVVFSLGAAAIGILPVLFLSGAFSAALLAGLGMSAVPLAVVWHLRNRRENTLVRQLPEAIDMIVRSLRAGQAVDHALREVGRSLDAPLSDEISAIYDEIAMGLPFDAALRKFENRFSRSSDVKIFCTTFIVQRETGGNLTEILDGLAATVRQRFKLKMQIRAFTAEGRVSAVIIGLIPVGFALSTYLLNPDYISLLFVHPVGKKLLLAAFLLEGLGFYLMRRLARIEA